MRRVSGSIKDGMVIASRTEDGSFPFGLTIRILKKRIRDDYMQRF